MIDFRTTGAKIAQPAADPSVESLKASWLANFYTANRTSAIEVQLRSLRSNSAKTSQRLNGDEWLKQYNTFEKS